MQQQQLLLTFTFTFVLCFLHGTHAATWQEAHAQCEAAGLGSLPVIADAAKQDAVEAYAQANGLTDNFWIGLAETNGAEWSLEWVDESPLTFAHFNPAGANNGGSRDCVFARASTGWTWEFGNCNSDMNVVVCSRDVFADPLPVDGAVIVMRDGATTVRSLVATMGVIARAGFDAATVDALLADAADAVQQ